MEVGLFVECRRRSNPIRHGDQSKTAKARSLTIALSLLAFAKEATE
jgi:hypothetical protein